MWALPSRITRKLTNWDKSNGSYHYISYKDETHRRCEEGEVYVRVSGEITEC
jgi:hypothetical protein